MKGINSFIGFLLGTFFRSWSSRIFLFSVSPMPVSGSFCYSMPKTVHAGLRKAFFVFVLYTCTSPRDQYLVAVVCLRRQPTRFEEFPNHPRCRCWWFVGRRASLYFDFTLKFFPRKRCGGGRRSMLAHSHALSFSRCTLCILLLTRVDGFPS